MTTNASAETLSAFVELASQLMCVANSEGYLEHANQAMLDFLGLTKTDLGRRPYIEFIHMQDRPQVAVVLSSLMSGMGEKAEVRPRMQCHDGSYRWTRWQVAIKGNQIFALGADVTDERRAEDELRLRYDEISLYEFCLNQSTIISRTNAEGIFTHVNDNFCKLSGYSRSELLGQYPRILASGHHSTGFFKDLWDTVRSGHAWRGQVQNRSKSSNLYWVDMHLFPLQNQQGVVDEIIAFSFDITAQKASDEKLHYQRNLFESLFNSMSEGMVLQDRTGAIIEANHRAAPILGLTMDQLLGRTSLDPRWQTIGEDLKPLRGDQHPAMVALTTGAHVTNFLMGVAKPSGEQSWLRINAAPIFRGDSQEPTHAVTTFQDVTQQRRDFEAIKTSRQQLSEASAFFRSLIDTAPSMIIAVRADSGHVAVLSRAAQAFFAVPAKEGSYGPAEAIFPKAIADLVSLTDAGQRQKQGVIEHPPLKTQLPSGDLKHIAVRQVVVRDADSQPQIFLSILDDITERIQAEEHLAEQRHLAEHNAKLASIGHLAAGVGHEINNPLAIANGFVHRLRELVAIQAGENPRIAECFTKYDQASARIANIVLGLRTYARSDDSSVGLFDVGHSIVETTALVREIYAKDGISIACHIQAKNVFASGQLHRFQQAMMNLIANARDAIEGCPTRQITVTMAANHETIDIAVQDTGRGIPPHVQSRLFTPFFTTKEVGKGTGIGLSLTLSIVNEHKGSITFQTSTDGTTFKIAIPRAAATTQAAPTAANTTAIAGNHSSQKLPVLKVLVVDDEPDLRELFSEILASRGCQVKQAGDGNEALEMVKREHFDLVLTDMKMPGMDGRTLIRHIHGLPDGRRPMVVAVTGGVSDVLGPASNRDLASEPEAYLFKPFSDDKVDEILAKARSRLRAAA